MVLMKLINYNHHIHSYMDKILTDKIPNNLEQKLMCKNIIIPVLERDDVYVDNNLIEEGLSLQKYFDFELIDWEKFLFALIVGVFFKDGRIFFNDITAILGRGSGKNGFISFLCFFFLSPYHGIERYDIDIIANGEEQAKRSFEDVWGVIEENHDINNIPALLQHYYATREIIYGKSTKSTLKYNTSSAKGKDSKRTACLIVDEKHEYTVRDAKTINTMKSGLGKKKNSRTITTTTDGFVRGGSLDQDKEKFLEVLSKYNPRNRKLIFWCRIEKEEEWKNPKMWIKANPSLNDFHDLREKIEEEVEDMPYTPDYFQEFMAKRMNFPIGNKTVEVASWEDLKACDKELDLEYLKKLPCIGAIDFAKTDDFVVVGLLFKDKGKYFFLHHTFVCKFSSDLVGIRAPLDDWEKMGMLEYVEDVEISGEVVANWFEARINEGFNIIKMAIDSYRFSLMSSFLKKIGFDAAEEKNIKLVRPSDLMQVAPIINTIFLRQLLSWGKSIIPGVQCIMCWYANNVKKVMTNGNIRFEKIEEHYRKTDGFMCFANGMTLESELEEEHIELTKEMTKLMQPLIF